MMHTKENPPDSPAQRNPAAENPPKIHPLNQDEQAAFEQIASRTRRLTEDELSKPMAGDLMWWKGE